MQADNPEQLEHRLHLATMLDMITHGYYSQACKQTGHYGIVVRQENIGRCLNKDLPHHDGVEISRNLSYVDGYSIGMIIPQDGRRTVEFHNILSNIPKAHVFELLLKASPGSVSLTTE